MMNRGNHLVRQMIREAVAGLGSPTTNAGVREWLAKCEEATPQGAEKRTIAIVARGPSNGLRDVRRRVS